MQNLPTIFSIFRWLFFKKNFDAFFIPVTHSTQSMFTLTRNRLDRFFRRVGSKTDLARLVDSPNSSSLDLMSYCPWAKKKTNFRETVRALFSSFFLVSLSIFWLCMLCWRCSYGPWSPYWDINIIEVFDLGLFTGASSLCPTQNWLNYFKSSISRPVTDR